ncbi:MAG: tyrosine-type recombinase/integrase [Candidatus Hodarchaeales archaeon]|jgi:integrase
MEPEYETIINRYRMNFSQRYIYTLTWVANKLPPVEKLTEEIILEILKSYSNEKTRRTFFVHLSVLLKALDKSYLIENILVKEPESSIKHSDLFSPDELQQLLRAASMKDKAILEFFIESGCRVGELLNLEQRDIQIQSNIVTVTLRGKTGTRTIPLNKDNLTNFLHYFAFLETDKVFKMCYHTLRKRLIKVYTKSGVKKRTRTTHIFRHQKATTLVELSVPEPIIKRFMGWSSKSHMLEKYLHLSSRIIIDFFSKLYEYNTEPEIKELFQ